MVTIETERELFVKAQAKVAPARAAVVRQLRKLGHKPKANDWRILGDSVRLEINAQRSGDNRMNWANGKIVASVFCRGDHLATFQEGKSGLNIDKIAAKLVEALEREHAAKEREAANEKWEARRKAIVSKLAKRFGVSWEEHEWGNSFDVLSGGPDSFTVRLGGLTHEQATALLAFAKTQGMLKNRREE